MGGMNEEQYEVKVENEFVTMASSDLDAGRKVEGPPDASTVERLGSDVISIVRSFIGALRLEFHRKIQSQTQLARISLYAKMKDRGLVENVRLIRRREQTDLQAQRIKAERANYGSEEKEDNKLIEENEDAFFVLQREKIMLEVALPLIELLAKCYAVLDALPTDVLDSNLNEQNSSNSRESRRRKNRPKPPRGMLSIQDYTDVACLLEFVVCTGILPFTVQYKHAASDSNNTNKSLASFSIIEERIRTKLPKALAGRIPKNALRWGTSSSLSSMLPNSLLSRKKEGSESLLIFATEAIAKLVLLDRFRPMLLPRHAVDLYDAIFYAEFNVTKTLKQGDRYSTISNQKHRGMKQTCSKSRRLVEAEYYQALGLSLPPFWFSLPPTGSTKHAGEATVDPTIRAISYQTLLSSSSSPSQNENQEQQRIWLRNRVSMLLTELATQDIRGLAAIVTVFVPMASSSTDQSSLMGGAAQRLGRTLVAMTTIPSSSHREEERGVVLQGKLCHQLLALLVTAFPVIVEGSGATAISKVRISTRSMAVIQTAWAVLENISKQTIDRQILEVWEHQLYHSRDKKLMKARNIGGGIYDTIRQIGALCAFVPPHSNRALEILERTLLKASSKGDMRYDNRGNIMGQILRVAMHDNLASENLRASASRDAEWTLIWLTQAIFADSSTVATLVDDQGKTRDQIVAAWITALGPTTWDLEGQRFICTNIETEERDINRVRAVEIQQHHRLEPRTPSEEFAESVQFTTKRAEFFVDNILLVLAPNARYVSNDVTVEETIGSQPLIQGLPSRIFRFLLRHYISNAENRSHAIGSGASASLRLVATVLLPIMCEKCSQEALLFGENQENSTGLLILIREVLSESAEEELNRYDDSQTKDRNVEGDTERYEFLKSIASLLLSMLIAVMELGSKLRSTEEEEIIQSFLPVLKRLLVPIDNRASNTKGNLREEAAMADMAAYAMTLIASRASIHPKLRETDNNMTKIAPGSMSMEDRLRRTLKDAETDLGSTQPPIRARGMVSLGKLARGFAGSLLSEQKTPSLILEIKKGSEDVLGDDNEASWIYDVLRLSMVALEDTESYVYLAAVQTIVAVGDLYPQQVLPLISSAIVRGELGSFSTVKINNNATPISLSQEQIIKLAEALIFIIRRRAVTDEYVPAIVSLMLHGTVRADLKKGALDGINNIQVKEQMLIQKATVRYFITGLGSKEEEENEENEVEDENNKLFNQKDFWEERDLRLKTGGPVFDLEEAEVVRSLRISILSELIAESSSAILAPFLKAFVRLVVEALNLDSGSRAVTRSAALLAREVYGKVLTEGWNLTEVVVSGGIADRSSFAAIPFSVALMASGNEEVLCASLKKGSRDASFRNRVIDSTLMTRCREALDLREQAKEKGIFAAAGLVLEERRKLDEMPGIFRDMVSIPADGESSTGADGENNVFQINPIETL